MPRKGHAYPIDDPWRDRVLDRIVEMKITQNELARRAKISKAALSMALNADSTQTTVMPEIHKALGWDVPQLAPMTADAQELLKLYAQRSDFDRGRMVERARSDVEKLKAAKPRTAKG